MVLISIFFYSVILVMFLLGAFLIIGTIRGIKVLNETPKNTEFMIIYRILGKFNATGDYHVVLGIVFMFFSLYIFYLGLTY